MRILLVEDDEVIASQLVRSLSKLGYQVDHSETGPEGLQCALLHPYQAIVLDGMLPGMDGWKVCSEYRAYGGTSPVLMLTARDEVENRVRGLDSGADDYLGKPFAFEELTARLRALTRRSQGSRETVLRAADLEIDTTAKTARVAGNYLKLTPREYDLLEALVRNRGRILTRETIIESIWGDDTSLSNTVNFHVTALRKKLDAGRDQSLIETVHGFGYRLRETE